MSYRLLAPATDDLDRIDDWIISNFGERAAIKAQHRLFNVFAMLAEQQHAGIDRPDVAAPPIRFFSLPPTGSSKDQESRYSSTASFPHEQI